MSIVRYINHNVLTFLISDGFYYAGYSMLNTFLSLLLVEKITGGRIDIVGFVISYYLFVRCIFEIPLRKLTRGVSLTVKRNLVAGSFILYGVFLLTLGFSSHIWLVFLIQTFLGLLDAFVFPMKWVIFSKIMDRGKEETEWGLEDIITTLMQAIFLSLAGVLANRYGIEAPFVLFAALLIISGCSFFAIEPRSAQTAKT